MREQKHNPEHLYILFNCSDTLQLATGIEKERTLGSQFFNVLFIFIFGT